MLGGQHVQRPCGKKQCVKEEVSKGWRGGAEGAWGVTQQEVG